MITRFLKRFAALITLCVVNVAAYATSSLSSLQSSMSSMSSMSAASSLFNVSAITNQTDASVTYLGQLFGQVGTVLSSTSSGFIGHMFDVYNKGVLVLAGIWILYTTYNTIVQMSDKQAEQKLTGLGMKFMKIAIAVVLVMPNATTGYSMVQDFTMWVVSEGVALADATWNSALNYLADGGSILGALSYSYTISSSSSLTSVSEQNGFFGGSDSATSADLPTVLAMQVCAIHNYSNWGTGSSLSTGTLYTTNSSGMITFKGGSCGSINSTPFTGLSNASGTLAQSAITTLLSNMKSAADYYACALHPGTGYTNYCTLIGVSSSTGTANVSTFNNYLADAFFGYISSLSALATNEEEGGTGDATSTSGSACTGLSSSSSVNSQLSCLVSTMQESGWINAGAYYWAIAGWMQNNGLFGSLLSEADVESAFALVKDVRVSMSNAPTASTYISNFATDVTTSPELSTIISNYSSALESEAASTTTSSTTTASSCTGDGCDNIIASSVWKPLLDVYVTLETNLASLSASSQSDDPLVILTMIGFNMINEAATLIAAAIVLIIVMAIIAILGFVFVVMINPIGFIFPILNAIINILKGIAMYLLAIGGMLAIYLPLYPWMTWTFAVIGWFIAVIESMAAAPLVCLGLTRPEGQELAGELKQGLMLLLSVFLKPALMIIGYCTAIVLSRIVLYYVLHSFAIVSLSLFVSSSSDISSAITSLSTLDSDDPNYLTDVVQMTQTLANAFSTAVSSSNTSFAAFVFEVIAIPTVFAIIGYVAYKVITLSFSLVFHLPNYVMKWIGSPSAGDGLSQQLMGAAEGGKSAAEAGTKAGSATLSGGMGAVAAVGGAALNAATSKQQQQQQGNKGSGSDDSKGSDDNKDNGNMSSSPSSPTSPNSSSQNPSSSSPNSSSSPTSQQTPASNNQNNNQTPTQGGMTGGNTPIE